jgi:epoxyqueuosine reductase
MQSTHSPQGLTRRFEPGAHIEQPACSPAELARRLRAHAAELGLAGLGFASVQPFSSAERALSAWLGAGYQGTMDYMASSGARSDPCRLSPTTTTMAVAAIATAEQDSPSHSLPIFNQVAAYAGGTDYHAVLHHKLAALGQRIADHAGRPIEARACVDTAPLLEREAARRSGLGFIGKSNMLIIPGIGSQVLLGVLLVDIAIAPDEPREHRCGRCTACLTACPTQAFVKPWLLDARRCIAYLTIEYKGWIAHELRPMIGGRIFGCDVCQDVCPYNHGKAAILPRGTAGTLDQPDAAHLLPWLTMSSSDYRRFVSGTALRRASRWQLLRNAAIAAGNSGDDSLVKPLAALLLNSTHPIVRGHAAWAVGRLRNAQAAAILLEALNHESDPDVLSEIRRALCRTDPGSAGST